MFTEIRNNSANVGANRIDGYNNEYVEQRVIHIIRVHAYTVYDYVYNYDVELDVGTYILYKNNGTFTKVHMFVCEQSIRKLNTLSLHLKYKTQIHV